MNKKLVNSKWLISFIAVLLAALALCFLGFVSSNAVADEPEPKIPDVPQGSVQIEAQSFNHGLIQYKIGQNGKWYNVSDASPVTLTEEDMKSETQLYLKLEFDKSSYTNREASIIHDGNDFLKIGDKEINDLFEGKYILNYDKTTKIGQYAKLVVLETRSVKVSLTEASSKILSKDFTLILGYGDKNDVKVISPKQTNDIRIDKGTTKKLNISFAIKSKIYFIPYIKVNGEKYETFDTGMHDEDDNVIICSTLEGSAASVNTFQVDLSIYAQPECYSRSQSMEIVQEATSYDYMIDGEVVNDGVYKLSGSDTQTDPQVENAVATYDLELTRGDEPVTTITGGMDMHLLLSTSTYSEQDYKVVRNHDGVVEELDTTCKVVRNRETGEVEGIDVGFNSDKFSDFSVVPANAEPVVPVDPQATAQTGDDIPVALVLMVLVTSAFVVFRTARKNHI